MYILIVDFQLVVELEDGGRGGGRNVYLHIGQIMQGSLSLTKGVEGGKKHNFCTVVPVVFSSGYSRPHLSTTYFLSSMMPIVHWGLSSKPSHC